jgi:hypothetical protein
MEPCIDTIYGYTPANVVGQHLSLDLDAGNLITALSANNLPLAYEWYSQGKNIHYFCLLLLFTSQR